MTNTTLTDRVLAVVAANGDIIAVQPFTGRRLPAQIIQQNAAGETPAVKMFARPTGVDDVALLASYHVADGALATK